LKTIVLVRHGETVANRTGVLSGWSDVRLTVDGIRSAALLEPLARDATVWSSDLRRCQQTAWAAGWSFAVDARLRELNFGLLEGERFGDIQPDVRDAMFGYRDLPVEGAETIAHFEGRVFGFVDRLPPGAHVLVTHGGVIRALTRRLGQELTIPPASSVALSVVRPLVG
jgi:broad specificity phosphatase PhoE